MNAVNVSVGFILKDPDILAVYLLSVSSDEPKSKLNVKVSPALVQILEKMEINEREKKEKIGEPTPLISSHLCAS